MVNEASALCLPIGHIKTAHIPLHHIKMGFFHVCCCLLQFIDVPDYGGVGETEPNPYFYQNLGEAEYLVRSCLTS